MKRMIVASVIMAFLTIAVIVNSLFVTNTIKQINELITELPENASSFGDGSSVIPIIDIIEQRWKKPHALISLSLQDDECRAVCLMISNLRVFAETGDFINFHSSAEQLRILLEHLYESEELSLKSIL